MNKDALNLIILKEYDALNKLLGLLDEQHGMLVKNDIFGLEDIVTKIQVCNKEIAEAEVERRSITNGNSMKEIVASFKDDIIDRNYRKLKKLLSEVKLQKDTNEMLIRQGLGFSVKMLNVLNPDRNKKTYNSYGKLGR